MLCRNCGIEIADRALICYRCGTATTEPLRKAPSPRKRAGGLIPATLALIVLILAALYMGRATAGEVPTAVGWVVALLAAVLVIWRVAAGR